MASTANEKYNAAMLSAADRRIGKVKKKPKRRKLLEAYKNPGRPSG